MEKNFSAHGLEFSIKEVEDGYVIHIKGDKEKIKAIHDGHQSQGQEEQEGCCGHGHHHGHHHGHKGKLFDVIHKHAKAMHAHKHGCCHDKKDQ